MSSKSAPDAICDVAMAGAGGFVAGSITSGIVDGGRYGISQMQQGTDGVNVPAASGQNTNTPGKSETAAVTTNNSGGAAQQAQQGAAARTQSGGNTVNTNSGQQRGVNTQQGGNVQTRAAGSTNTPTAVVESGNVRASTSGEVQTQAQTQPSVDTRTQAEVQARTQALKDTKTGKTVKSEGKVTELLQKAMAQPADSPVRQLAETLLSQQQTALIEQGLDLDSQYQLSHADQAQFAAETANHAVSDQMIGELERLVDMESQTTGAAQTFTQVDKTSFKTMLESDKITAPSSEKLQQFDRKAKNYTQQEDTAEVNPNDSRGAEYRQNCQRCVPTYELRRRGYNVFAKPAKTTASGDLSHDDILVKNNNWYDKIFKGIRWTRASSGNGLEQIKAAMSQWGNGARAEVYVAWKNGGAHVFVAEQIGNETVFIDPQSGNAGHVDAFEFVIDGRTFFARIDNLPVTDLIEACSQNGGE